MPGVARAGDMVSCTCCCHPPIPCIGTVGFFVTYSSDTFADGLNNVRLGDMAMCACGHPTFVVAGSPDTFVNGLPQARLGDPVAACPVGTIVSASGDHIDN